MYNSFMKTKSQMHFCTKTFIIVIWVRWYNFHLGTSSVIAGKNADYHFKKVFRSLSMRHKNSVIIQLRNFVTVCSS
jgi:hypothetical protein